MYNKISKYRDAVMGIAILQIMLHHSGLNLPNPFFFLKRYMGGPDIFMFLSGFGCAVSLTRNKDKVSFYFRRIKRIYPHFIPILIIFLIMSADNLRIDTLIRDFLGNLTGLTYWAMTGKRFNWYLVALPLFYILTPVFYDVIQKLSYKGLIILLCISFIAGWCFASVRTLTSVARFPIYILGIAAGMKLFEDEKKFSSKNIYIGGIIGCVILALMYKFKNYIPDDYYIVFYPCILMTPAIIYLFFDIFELIKNEKIVQIFSFIGKISLDIYIIHITFFGKVGKIFMGGYDNTKPFPASIGNILAWILIFIVTVLVSYLYNILIGKTEKIIFRESKKAV